MSNKSFDDLLDTITASRKKNALQKILRHNNICKIWIGGTQNDRYDYPYRLVPADKATERIRDSAQELMLDSSINDPSLTNRDVIEKAIELDVQWVIPKDYWGDIERTHESIIEFLDLYDNSDCRAKIIIPMQPPHDKHYLKYEDFYAQFSHFAIGGLKDAGAEKQIKAAETFRDVVGDHKWIHGLGMGCSKKIINALREKDPFLDSIDAGTFETAPGQYGKVAGNDWIQHSFDYPSGDEIATLTAIQMEYLAYQANYQLTPFANEFNKEKPDEQPDPNQSTLSEAWETPNSTDQEASQNKVNELL
ncbi:hypothetical protein [Salinibaculum rarum]|uniref:hypothetical protein n=1 Tax=Salinibaculum rarum TaxID=3058903 RepID=UPI00265EFEA2|nr:hypothetical protein [Salinibaculum sp. KK48]